MGKVSSEEGGPTHAWNAKDLQHWEQTKICGVEAKDSIHSPRVIRSGRRRKNGHQRKGGNG